MPYVPKNPRKTVAPRAVAGARLYRAGKHSLVEVAAVTGISSETIRLAALVVASGDEELIARLERAETNVAAALRTVRARVS